MSMARIWNGSPLGFTKKGKPIAWDGNEPTLIFGPPGSFKTVGYVCTSLLDDDGGKRSYLVIDPKGEVAAITARFRRSLPGHEVKIINPYGVLVDERPDLKSDGWNPLAALDPQSRTFGDECQALGDALIKTGSNETQPHFPDSARSGMTATTMYEVRDAKVTGRTPSLPFVRAVLTQEPEKLKASVRKMVDCGDFDIATRAAKFLADNNEIQSIKSTIETQTAWMTKPMRDDMTAAGAVDFNRFATHPTTCYVIVPTSELQAKGTYLRLVLAAALRALYRHDGVPATLIVEEGFVLGHHAEIEAAASILRGYGSRFTIVFQSLQQAKKLYPETWGLFTGGAVLGFRPADLETAKWMTEKAGKVTVPVYGASDPRPGEPVGQGGWQQRERDRIPLASMFGMPRGRALVWLPHDGKPRISWVRGYFEIPKLAARADPNPYFKGAAARPGGRKLSRLLCAAVMSSALLVPSAWLGAPHAADEVGVRIGARGELRNLKIPPHPGDARLAVMR
jgi:type IV secretion system protein VirD4